MKYTNFEDYLQTQQQIENPTVLDDDLPESYEGWTSDLSPEEWIYYAQQYADLIKKDYEPSEAIKRWRANSVKPWDKVKAIGKPA